MHAPINACSPLRLRAKIEHCEWQLYGKRDGESVAVSFWPNACEENEVWLNLYKPIDCFLFCVVVAGHGYAGISHRPVLI